MNNLNSGLVETYFEGSLEHVTKHGKTSHWCTLCSEALSFYKNKRSSCMYRIELGSIKSFTLCANKAKFVVTTKVGKEYVYAAENADLCAQWIHHIGRALELSKNFASNDHLTHVHDSPRRGSLPHQDSVHNAIKQLSSHTPTKQPEAGSREVIQTRVSTKEIVSKINRKSQGDENNEVRSKQRPRSTEKVSSLALRFSAGERTSQEVPNNISPSSPTRNFTVFRSTKTHVNDQSENSCQETTPNSCLSNQTKSIPQGSNRLNEVDSCDKNTKTSVTQIHNSPVIRNKGSNSVHSEEEEEEEPRVQLRGSRLAKSITMDNSDITVAMRGRRPSEDNVDGDLNVQKIWESIEVDEDDEDGTTDETQYNAEEDLRVLEEIRAKDYSDVPPLENKVGQVPSCVMELKELVDYRSSRTPDSSLDGQDTIENLKKLLSTVH